MVARINGLPRPNWKFPIGSRRQPKRQMTCPISSIQYCMAPETFKHVLVAVSASSRDAVLASAIEVAREYDARVCALHVVDLRPCFIASIEYDFGLIVEALQAQGREIIAQSARVLNEAACSADTRLVALPNPGVMVGPTIAAVAKETGTDLIVLGKRKAGWGRWLSENVSSEVRRHTSVPILVAPDETA
jgi:nucleotide-binding universal stress UspA family protein